MNPDNRASKKSSTVDKTFFSIGVSCVDERIDPFKYSLVFRTPGACVFPRQNEPSYTLAAILFFISIASDLETVFVEVADHGIPSKTGYIDCGMAGASKLIPDLEGVLNQETSLSPEEIDNFLSRLAVYDLNNVGGIGKHAQWEVSELKEISADFLFDYQLGKIMPNSPERERIPNERLVITQPYVSQEGLLLNIDENGNSFDGRTIAQTISGLPDVTNDANLTNGLIVFGYEKGENIREVLILEPVVGLLDSSAIRSVLLQIDLMLDLKIKEIGNRIYELANMSSSECYRYLHSIKETARIDLFGIEMQRLAHARKIAETIQKVNLLPKKVHIKYGLVNLSGKIIDGSIRNL